MGHQTILVIGDNFRDQLDKYQRAEYASPTNRHLGPVNYLEEAKQEFAVCHVSFFQDADGNLHDPSDAKFFRAAHGEKQPLMPKGFKEVRLPAKGRISFLDWVKRVNGYDMLSEHQVRDADGKHKLGWNRVNADGEIIEMFAAGIPGGFYDWFSSIYDVFQLKPGAMGIVTNDDGEETTVTGFAGSAKKSAIDFDAMREVMRTAAAERWDRAVAAVACATGPQSWIPFEALWKKYQNQKFDHDLYISIKKQWAAQPGVKAIIDDCRISPGSFIRSAVPVTTGIIDDAQIDDVGWQDLSVTERAASSLVWNDHTETGIDPLALPQDQYVQRFGLWHLLGYGAIIKDGMLLGQIDVTQLFDSMPDGTVLTLASVHC
jgi:hypothetical protein